MTQTAKQKIYLNRIEIDEKKSIKLYFFKAPNEQIIRRITNNDWIRFDAKRGVYFAVEQDNTIGLITELFDDIASVTPYLDYKEQRIKISKQRISNGYEPVAIQKRKNLISITLLPIQMKGKEYIGIKHHFQKSIYNILKLERFISWNAALRLWVFESTNKNINKLYTLIGDKYFIKLSASIEITDIKLRQKLLEQIYVKDKYYKTCPYNYLAYMQLHNYSWNTMITYHGMVLRYLNTYKTKTIENLYL